MVQKIMADCIYNRANTELKYSARSAEVEAYPHSLIFSVYDSAPNQYKAGALAAILIDEFSVVDFLVF